MGEIGWSEREEALLVLFISIKIMVNIQKFDPNKCACKLKVDE